MTPFQNPAVKARFAAYPTQVRPRMLALRALVLRAAADTPRAGPVEETLKWGEPAYTTPQGAGSTVRIDWKPKHPQQCAVYFNCQTKLVETFRQMFPKDFGFEGRRALMLPLEGPLPEDALAVCVAASLTYHLDRRRQPPVSACAPTSGHR